MAIINVLKRKDGASLVTGVVLAYVILEFLTTFCTTFLNSLSFLRNDYMPTSPATMSQYVRMVTQLLLEILLLELGIRAYVYINAQLVSNKKR